MQLRALADAAGAARPWPEDLRGVLVGADRGPPACDWRERLEEGLDGGRFVAEQTGGSPVVIYAAIVLVLSDEVERAEALLADIRADARARGSIISHLVDLAWGAFLWLRRGELRDGRGGRARGAVSWRADRAELGRDLDGRLPVLTRCASRASSRRPRR